jgi:hypothetical protein
MYGLINVNDLGHQRPFLGVTHRYLAARLAMRVIGAVFRHLVRTRKQPGMRG